MEAVIWTVAREEKFQRLNVYHKHLPFSSFIARCSWSRLFNVKANIRKQYEHWRGLYLQVSLSMIIKLESAWRAKICLSDLHCFQNESKGQKEGMGKIKKKNEGCLLTNKYKASPFSRRKTEDGKECKFSNCNKILMAGPWPRPSLTM